MIYRERKQIAGIEQTIEIEGDLHQVMVILKLLEELKNENN